MAYSYKKYIQKRIKKIVSPYSIFYKVNRIIDIHRCKVHSNAYFFIFHYFLCETWDAQKMNYFYNALSNCMIYYLIYF